MAKLCSDEKLKSAGWSCKPCNCGGSLKEKWIKGNIKIDIVVRRKLFYLYKNNLRIAKGPVINLQNTLEEHELA